MKERKAQTGAGGRGRFYFLYLTHLLMAFLLCASVSFQTGPSAQCPVDPGLGAHHSSRHCGERAPPSGGSRPLGPLLPLPAQPAPVPDPPGTAGRRRRRSGDGGERKIKNKWHPGLSFSDSPGFTLLAFDLPSSAPPDLQPSPVQSIMQSFGWDDMLHPLLVTRYLPHLLQNRSD